MSDGSELEQAVAATGIGAVLVMPRILRRVIKHHRRIPGVGLDVPHAWSYVVPRATLTEIVREEELGHSFATLSESVILLPRPEIAGVKDRTEAIVAVWRGAFHASVHRAIEARVAVGGLSGPNLRARIHAVGQTEFDEIRFVLKQDDVLLPPHDDVETYAEFAATYLELRHFAPELLARTFPGLENLDAIDSTLAQDVDHYRLLAASRPSIAPPMHQVREWLAPPAPDEPVTYRTSSAHTAAINVDARAERARKKGNSIRSILLRVRAQGTQLAVFEELKMFMDRLSSALVWVDAPTAEWARKLLPVVHMAPSARGLPWNPEARLLFDLQNACIDNERELYTLDVVEWALTRGKRPIKRPLPAQRDVRIAKHLYAALAKLPRTAVAEPARSDVADLLRQFARRAELNVRAALGPHIGRALEEVGLRPENIPEQVSKKKLVEELLDQIVGHGYISLGHLRDSLSRSNLKMSNLTWRELVDGDALLKADRIVSQSLDGVYRRGEVYLRGLQKLNSILFGTRIGRVATLYAILPFVGAFVVLEGVQHTIGLLLEKLAHIELKMLQLPSFLAVAVLIFALVHSDLAREVGRRVLTILGIVLRFLFFTVPSAIWNHPITRGIVKSRPIVWLTRYLLKPLLLAAPFSLITRAFGVSWIFAAIPGAALFVGWNTLLNSRVGRLFEEAATDWLVRRWRQLRRRVLPGLFGFIADFFRRLLEVVDRFIYAIDELLRFREGEGKTSYYTKATLGIGWFFCTYLIRIYVNLLLEPEVNPIKHFPVVTVAAKIMIPITPPIHDAMAKPLTKVLGGVVAESIAAPTMFVLPGFFGFLTWELKENWRLYRMNRAPNLSPVIIGHHGETMVGFMKPGVHSGTIPKLYAKLRRATWKRERSALRHREALHHVEESIRKFVEREIVLLLAESRIWSSGPLEVGHIDAASNRVRVELFCRRVSDAPVKVAFEEQSGWLVGCLHATGFIDALDVEQRAVFENALAGVYKMAGVDLVREQVSALLRGAPYDISDQGLVVWPDASYSTEVVYPLSLRLNTLKPKLRSGAGPVPPPIDGRLLLFRRQPISWIAWVAAWSGAHGMPARLLSGPSLLPSRR
ncbi:MAG: hypothetical protein U0271_35440 [Polyangiaceae bacterium]